MTAARIPAEVDDIHRFHSEARLASYAGVAPLEASSVRQQRHRPKPRRQPPPQPHALHIALTQIRIACTRRAYYAQRTSEGKTRRDAIRTLRRQLVRSISRILKAAAPRRVLGAHPHRG